MWKVKKVLIEQGLNIQNELYRSIIPDRATATVVIIASEVGGMGIETVAEKRRRRSSRSISTRWSAFRPTTAAKSHTG